VASEFQDPERIGIVTGLIAIVGGNLRGWWYSGMAYRERVEDYEKRLLVVTEDRDFYRNALFRTLEGIDRRVGDNGTKPTQLD
jgi:hypothetical protein